MASTTPRGLFETKDYKQYLVHRFGDKSERRGLKSKAATAIGCQATYLSQVLHGHAHLSLEQADALNAFFSHSKAEADYFLLLVQRAKAGTPSLRKHFDEQLELALAKRLHLVSRQGGRTPLTATQQATYYSSWHYAACHIAVTVPSLQDREALANHLKISPKRVAHVVDFLLETGLIDERGRRLRPGTNFVRIGSDSPHIARHHANWRQAAVESLDREGPLDLHYSAAVSLSKKDVIKIKERILEDIKGHVDTIRQSPEEELYVLNMDFFSLER